MSFDKNQSLRECFNARKQDEEMVFVFDLDCTLIDTRPLYPQMLENAAHLLMDRVGMEYDEAIEATQSALADYNGYVREAFFDRYGIPGHETTDRVYHPSTMDMSLIEAPQHIIDMLEGVEGKVYLYTNSTEAYARGVLEALGLDKYFDGVFGTDTLDHTRKPDNEALRRFERRTGAKAENIWFFEDSLENLAAAKKLGWHTVLVTEFIEGNLHDKERQELPVKVDRLLQSLSELTAQEQPQRQRAKKPGPQ